MKNTNFRIATIDDEAFIKRLYKEAKNEIGSFNLYYSWDDFLSGKSPYKFYIVEDEEQLIGFMRFGFSKMIKSYVVKEIAISKEHRGKGWGKKFIERMPKPIYLTCNDDNVNGNKFYETIGMINIGKKKNKNGKLTRIWICQF